MIVNCAECQKEVDKPVKQVNQNTKRNLKFYCSRTCMGKHRTKKISVYCERCNKELLRTPAQINNHIYCSKSCAIKINNVNRIPKDSILTYRHKALKFLPNKCAVCGYNNIKVLEVHHIDSDRNNNTLANLLILCPTHHKEFDLGLRTIKDMC